MTTLPWWPIVWVDIVGSSLALVFAWWCALRSWRWARDMDDDIFRHYLFLLTAVICIFAVSRSVGHLAKQILVLADKGALWSQIAPYSGAANSCVFVAIFSFCMLFGRIRRAKVQMETSALDMASAKAKAAAIASDMKRLNAVFEGMEAYIYVSDTDHRIKYANNKLRELLPDIGQESLSCDVFCHERNCDRCTCDVVVGNGKILHSERAVPGKDVVVRLAEIPIDWVDGEKVKLSVAFDVTDSKRLETRLRQAQKMEAIGTLAGGVAHDFNNILAAIVGYTDMTLLHVEEGTSTHHNLNQIMKASFRARDVVQQILSFSRQTRQELRPVDVSLAVREALKLLRASIPSTVEIRENIDSSSGKVLADPTQLHQVLMNLCTNAHHAMRERGGVLEVALDRIEVGPSSNHGVEGLPAGPYVRLTVRDTGHGMDAETRERIFEPYFTTKGVGEGSGMGLAVVHGIVSAHHGAVTVESEPGRGSTFSVYLPRLEDAAEPSATPSRPAPRGKERILFVDDEEALATLGKGMLEGLGYRVTSTTSSVEALERFRRSPQDYDLVVTDHTLPHMTGATLAGEMLAIRADLPIILCTGHNDALDEGAARELGARAFLKKPFSREMLAETVRNVLDSEGPVRPR